MQTSAVRSTAASSNDFCTTTLIPPHGGHAEGLPDDGNAITLDPQQKDSRGLPVSRVTYEWGANDIKLAAAARDKAVEMMTAAGARSVRIGLNYGAHAMGTCRMGRDPSISVVNE